MVCSAMLWFAALCCDMLCYAVCAVCCMRGSRTYQDRYSAVCISDAATCAAAAPVTSGRHDLADLSLIRITLILSVGSTSVQHTCGCCLCRALPV
jgi:hypothetical protein